MSLQGRVLIVIMGLGLIMLAINLVRTQKLHTGLGLLWLAATVSLIVLVSFPSLLELVTEGVGATYPASALSLLAFAFIFLVLIFFSVQLTRLSMRQVDIVQYLAMKELTDQEKLQLPEEPKEQA